MLLYQIDTEIIIAIKSEFGMTDPVAIWYEYHTSVFATCSCESQSHIAVYIP